MATAEIAACLSKVQQECDKVASMRLFNTSIGKCVQLDEFRTIQSQAYDHVHGYLKNTWVPACKSTVHTCLRNFGKGWFNLQETNQQIYESSKLAKFLNAVRFIMQDALRSLVKVRLFS